MIILINPLNAKLNPICHFLALLGAHHILHVSRIRVEFPPKEQYMHIKLKKKHAGRINYIFFNL
jgi:hypothetical protein